MPLAALPPATVSDIVPIATFLGETLSVVHRLIDLREQVSDGIDKPALSPTADGVCVVDRAATALLKVLHKVSASPQTVEDTESTRSGHAVTYGVSNDVYIYIYIYIWCVYLLCV